MTATTTNESASVTSGATVDRTSDRELVVTRTINAPARIVFDAWTKPELFQRWWVPRSMPMRLVTCEMDVRVGGGYRLVFDYDGSTFEFFGKYIEVTPPSRLAWTNDEGGGEQVTTVTFDERDGRTHLTIHDLYPSKEALDRAIASGSTGGLPEQLEQLDELLATLDTSEA
ncbi:MAG TPA: SRPBCC family protein [Candidatus Binatia bacterium]|nr:SRPBCC family protein [Candidatus Binatia bacterium]